MPTASRNRTRTARSLLLGTWYSPLVEAKTSRALDSRRGDEVPIGIRIPSNEDTAHTADVYQGPIELLNDHPTSTDIKTDDNRENEDITKRVSNRSNSVILQDEQPPALLVDPPLLKRAKDQEQQFDASCLSRRTTTPNSKAKELLSEKIRHVRSAVKTYRQSNLRASQTSRIVQEAHETRKQTMEELQSHYHFPEELLFQSSFSSLGTATTAAMSQFDSSSSSLWSFQGYEGDVEGGDIEENDEDEEQLNQFLLNFLEKEIEEESKNQKHVAVDDVLDEPAVPGTINNDYTDCGCSRTRRRPRRGRKSDLLDGAFSGEGLDDVGIRLERTLFERSNLPTNERQQQNRPPTELIHEQKPRRFLWGESHPLLSALGESTSTKLIDEQSNTRSRYDWGESHPRLSPLAAVPTKLKQKINPAA